MFKRMILALMFSLLLVACGADNEADYPDGVEEAVEHFSEELDIDDDDISIISYEETQWSDACLGLGEANESCAAAMTAGWEIEAELDGKTYYIRSDEAGDVVRWTD